VAIESAFGQCTFAELLNRVESVADCLTAESVRTIALAADNGSEWITCDLAARLAGVTVVPLAPFFSQQQCRHAIADAHADAIVFDAGGEFLAAGCNEGHRSRLMPGLSMLKIGNCDRSAYSPAPAKISYTSGTTGTPKGVRLSWDAQNLVANSLVSVTKDLALTRHTCILPLGVLLENVAGVYAPLIAGATVVCPSLSKTGVAMAGFVDGAQVLDLLASTKADSAIVLPQILDAMVAAMKERPVSSKLRFVAVGGASTPETLIREARSLGLPVFEGYGLTECCSVVALNTPRADSIGSVGRPLPHTKIRVAQDGEIIVAGAVLDGYTGGAVFSDSEFRTGDIGFIDAGGYLHVRGRKRNAFITSFGRNVSPEWLEAELCGSTAIAQAVVFGENRPWNVAVVMPQTKATTAEEIDAAILSANETLPGYAQITRWIRADEAFSVANGMLTANGRYRRAEIFACYGSRIAACYENEPNRPSQAVLSIATREPDMSNSERLKVATERQREQLLATPIIVDCFEGRVDLPSYVAFLTQAYHHVRHTVPLLMACGARLPERLDWLQPALVKYIEEEHGHEQWILNDIAACGGDAGSVKAGIPALATEVMVSYAYDSVFRGNPVSFFGMVFVLETTSAAIASDAAISLAESLSLPRQAFTYLSSHGRVDQEHVGDLADVVDRLDQPDDLQSVVHMAQVMYELYRGMFESIPRSQALRDRKSATKEVA
jgi:acyl-CoA synthetase (AMP-forming)/AMP-acid ligase II